MVDEQKIVVHDILNENVDELPEFRDRVIKVSLGECCCQSHTMLFNG